MLLSDIKHLSTLKSIERHNIDPELFENIHELRNHIKKMRISNSNKLNREKNKDKQKEYMKNYMPNYMKEYYQKNKHTMKFSKSKMSKEYYQQYYRKKKEKEFTIEDSMPSIQPNQ